MIVVHNVRTGQEKIRRLYFVMYVCAVVHVNVEFGPPLGGSEAVYLLQTQPMFTFEITKAIDVVLPLSVKALRSIRESLQCIDYKGNSCMLETYIIEESYCHN